MSAVKHSSATTARISQIESELNSISRVKQVLASGGAQSRGNLGGVGYAIVRGERELRRELRVLTDRSCLSLQ